MSFSLFFWKQLIFFFKVLAHLILILETLFVAFETFVIFSINMDSLGLGMELPSKQVSTPTLFRDQGRQAKLPIE